MAHYIDIEKAEEDFINFRCDGCECYPDGCDNCLIHEGAEFFINYDESDVKPVVHGKWENRYFAGDRYVYICSNCGYDSEDTNYCAKCGAKMDKI